MKFMPAVLILSLLSGAPLAAPAASQTAVVTVTGQGRATAAPDMATETFTIATNADSAAAATSDNNTRYNRFMKAVERLGVAHADIRTTGYNVSYNPPPQPQPQQMPPSPPQRYGYFVNRSIEVTLHNLALVGKVIDGAVASGVTDIGGVSYGISDRRGQFQLALRDAVSDARSQAEAMAAAAGLHVVRVKSMGQGYPQVVQPRMMAADVYAAAPAPPTQIEPSNVEVTATVTITYEVR